MTRDGAGFVRPLGVIRAEQRLALARVMDDSAHPDHDVALCLCELINRCPGRAEARRLLRYWHERAHARRRAAARR